MSTSPFGITGNVDVHGTLPGYVIEDMEVDKLGILSAAIRIQYPFPLKPDWLLPWKASQVFPGVPCTKIRVGLQERDGMCNLIYTFEGFAGNASDFPQDQATCEVDCTTMAVDIRLHPRFLTLTDKYAGKFDPANKDDFWYFAKNLPKALQTGDPDANTGAKNPLYGTEQYETPRLVWRRTYLTGSLPANLLDGVGYIDNTLAQGLSAVGPQPPQLKGRANWLLAVLRAQWRGNIWSVTKEWWASSGDPWNEDIYRIPT